MLSLKKILLLLLLIGAFSSAHAQGEIAILPAHNPTFVQFKLMAFNRCISNAEYLTKADSELDIQAYTFKDEQLVVQKVQVDLVRKGRKIVGQEFSSKVDLAYLLTLAKDDDMLCFHVGKVFVKNNGKLQIYADGRMNFNFRYRATESLGFLN
jgi:hypothetical protein